MIQTFLHNTATFKAQRVSDAPAGFQYSAKHTVSSADSSLANTDEAMFIHRIEGFDTAKFAYGTSSAKQITVSFYVKSSLTGDFSFAAQTGSRNYVNEYTINSANTWERKSFTLPVLTTGTHNTTNGSGIAFIWDLGSGDDYATSTLGSWVTASNLYRSTGSARLSTNASATWQITGIQVEEGTIMTDFEHRSYGDELQSCKRYYQNVGSTHYGATEGTTQFRIQIPLYPHMRSAPTCTVRTGKKFNTRYLGDTTITTPTTSDLTSKAQNIWTGVTSSGLTAGIPIYGRSQQGADGDFLSASAEL
jgi:hypothetical protein